MKGNERSESPRPGGNTDAYLALCAKAAEIGWPEHYRDDLTYWDHDQICGGGGDSIPEGAHFTWYVRQCGTFVVRAGKDHWLEGHIRAYESKSHRAFEWDGCKLTEVSIKPIPITRYG